jgi:hypothetical protein
MREDHVNRRKLHSGVALIEVNDPLVLTEIENDASLLPYLGQRLSERCVAVQPEAIPQIVRRLQGLGHMPRVIN